MESRVTLDYADMRRRKLRKSMAWSVLYASLSFFNWHAGFFLCTSDRMQGLNEHSLVTNAVQAGAQIATCAMTDVTNSNDAYLALPIDTRRFGYEITTLC